MEWPPSFYELRRGIGCAMCQQGRPEATDDGVRFYAGEVSDAYLRRTNIQRGLTVVIWRGRHVAEPTELNDEEAHGYWRDLLIVGRTLEDVLRPVKTNYNVLGKRCSASPYAHRPSLR